MEHPDSFLLKKVLLGERSFYSLLVERYGPAVAAIAAHHLSDPEEIEKITTESFVEAFRELRRFDNVERFFPYLIEVARKKAAVLSAGKASANSTSPELSQTSYNLFDAALPQIVRWKYFEGLSYEEIAKRLGMTPEKIQIQLRQGRSVNHFTRAKETA